MKIDLKGPDGNATALMAYAKQYGKELDLDYEKIITEMKKSDYQHLVKIFIDNFGMVLTIVGTEGIIDEVKKDIRIKKDDYKQLCVWPGTIIGDEIKQIEFVKFMEKEFDVRIKYESEETTNPDPGNPESGGRLDAFFYVHDDDVGKFAVPRLKAGIRWWEDIFFNNQEYLYSSHFIAEHPRTW